MSTTVDPYDHLEIALNPDGSLSRNSTSFPDIPPTPVPDPDNPTPVLSKDITFNDTNKTSFRVYLPNGHRHKLPVIFYYHGGGFIVCTAATSVFHVFCENLAASVPAVVISVDYRLAPESRLPAAYHDALEALRWVSGSPRRVDWIRDHADLSKCFLMGTSAGANMAYHVAQALDHDLGPLRIRGLVLHEPFFGSVARTGSEMRHVTDLMLRPGVTDVMWELALPVGADRDHEYCNIKSGHVKRVGYRVLVTGFQGDPLYDHGVEAAEYLRGKGFDVAVEFWEGGFHAADVFLPSMAKPMHHVLKTFINTCVS